MSSTTRNLAIVVGIIVALVGGLFIYTKYFVTDAVPGMESVEANPNFPGKEIKERLTRINGLNLSAGTGLFADAAYQSLHDSTIVLTVEPAGRPNPFLPVVRNVPQPISKTPVTKKSTAR